ncbi:MAG: hypothetical protein IPN76_27235 [Saprospiraceae bacterium]|nr:hypothetical protein [Saprospiraceae bacterium]
MNTQGSLTRFSHTVENYIRYRPGYPPDLLEFMKNKMGLSAQSVVVDIGAGTNKLTELFLQNGNPIHAVEPNAFLRDFSTDLDKIDHRHISEEQLAPFFGKNGFAYHEIYYLQTFDFEGVKGRYLSCSYAFDEKHPRHATAMQRLSDTFEVHSETGMVDFWYLTKIYFGQIA